MPAQRAETHLIPGQPLPEIEGATSGDVRLGGGKGEAPSMSFEDMSGPSPRSFIGITPGRDRG